MEAASDNAFYLDYWARINLKNHCLICLQHQELKTLREVAGRGTKLNGDFTPIINYLTGTDPTYDKSELKCHQKGIPLIKSLPPLCPSCFNTLARLHDLHEELLSIQGLIQKQTEFARHVVTKTIQSSSMYLSTREIFCSEIHFGGISSEAASNATYKFVEGLHDKIIGEGNNKVQYPSRVPPDYVPHRIPQEASVTKSIPSTVNLLCMRSDGRNPEVNGGPSHPAVSLAHPPADNMPSVPSQHSVTVPLDKELADYAMDTAAEGEDSEGFGSDHIGTIDGVTDLWVPFGVFNEEETEAVVPSWNQQDTFLGCDGNNPEINGGQPRRSVSLTFHPADIMTSISSQTSFVAPVETRQPDRGTDHDPLEENSELSGDVLGAVNEVIDIAYPIDMSSESEKEDVEHPNPQPKKKRRLDFNVMPTSVPTTDNLLRIRFAYGSTSEMNVEQSENPANFTFHAVDNRTSMSSQHSTAFALETAQADCGSGAEDVGEFESDDIGTGDGVMVTSFPPDVLECDVPGSVGEVLARLDADGITIKGNTRNWRYLIQRALSIPEGVGEEELAAFVADITYAYTKISDKNRRSDPYKVQHCKNTIRGVWKREKVCRILEMRRLPEDMLQKIRERLIGPTTPLPWLDIRDDLSAEAQNETAGLITEIQRVSQKLAFNAGKPNWRRIIGAALAIRNPTDLPKLDEFTASLKSIKFWSTEEPFKRTRQETYNEQRKRVNRAMVNMHFCYRMQKKVCAVLHSLNKFPEDSLLYLKNKIITKPVNKKSKRRMQIDSASSKSKYPRRKCRK